MNMVFECIILHLVRMSFVDYSSLSKIHNSTHNVFPDCVTAYSQIHKLIINYYHS